MVQYSQLLVAACVRVTGNVTGLILCSDMKSESKQKLIEMKDDDDEAVNFKGPIF